MKAFSGSSCMAADALCPLDRLFGQGLLLVRPLSCIVVALCFLQARSVVYQSTSLQ